MSDNVVPLRPEDDLVGAVDRATREMTWLKPTDKAMVALARFYAKQIQDADHPARAAETIGLRLENTIKALGGTPLQRKAIEGETGPIKNRLEELRRQRQEGNTA